MWKCVGGFFFGGGRSAGGWMAGLQVVLAGMLILLVKYDPAGRNCLAPPSTPARLLCLSV